MSRYIDGEAALNAIKDYEVDAPEYMEGWACKLVDAVKGDIYGLIKEIPTVDAVEVVRCKECRYYTSYMSPHGINMTECDYGHCHAWTEPNGYCHRGKRKNNDQNT